MFTVHHEQQKHLQQSYQDISSVSHDEGCICFCVQVTQACQDDFDLITSEKNTAYKLCIGSCSINWKGFAFFMVYFPLYGVNI